MIKNILPEFDETFEQRDFRQSYMKAINKAYKYDESIGIMDIGEDKKISLQDIYVPLKFSKRDGEENSRLNNSKDLIDLFYESNNIVLSGKPGSGKTTLSRFIISSLSSYELTLLSKNFGRKLPLYIKLRDYKLEDIKNFDNFFDLYIETASNILKINIKKEDIEFYLKNGWCFLIFDGIDEVGNKSNRLKIRNYILKNFSQYNKNNYILVTSRPTGIENSYFFNYTEQEERESKKDEITESEKLKLDNNINELIENNVKSSKKSNKNQFTFPTLYYVSQFNDEQINIYSNNWFKLREENPDVIINKVKDFISSIDKIKNLAILKRRPVFLSMMIHIHTTKGKLPYSRAMAYKYMVEAYIEHIDIARRLNKLYSKDWSFEDKERLLEELAYRLHSSSIDNIEEEYNSSFQITLNKEQLKETIRNIIEDNIEKWQTVEKGDENELLEFYISRTGLLHEPEENKIQFSHLSFQEYLTAHSIYKKVIEHPFEIKNRIKNEILDRLDDPKWKEVILIFFSLYKDATHSILEQFKDSNKSYEYYELILTLLDSIEYGIQDSYVQFWVKNLLEFCFYNKINEKRNESKVYNLVEKLFNNNRVKISLIEKEINTILEKKSSDNDKNLENIGIILSYNENIIRNNKSFIYNNFNKYLQNNYIYLCEIFISDFPDLYKEVAEKYSLSNLILFYETISYSGKLLFLEKKEKSWKSKYLKYHWSILNIFALVAFTKFINIKNRKQALSNLLKQFNELSSYKYHSLNEDWNNFWNTNIWHEHRNGRKLNLDKHNLFSHFEYYYYTRNVNQQTFITNNESLNEELQIFNNNSTKNNIFLKSIMIILFSNKRIESEHQFNFINTWKSYKDFYNFTQIFINPDKLHNYLEKELSLSINKDNFISEINDYYEKNYSIKKEIEFIRKNSKFFNILSYDEFKKELVNVIEYTI